jgi:hypothetical protein
MNIGLRFTNITIPQGVTINSATIEVYHGANNVSGVPTGQWQAWDVDSAGQFGGANRPSTVPLTTSYVTHNPTSGAGWKSASIGSVIQEIVNRPGWVSDNTINLVWMSTSTGGSIWQDFNDVEQGSNTARLTINYTPICWSSELLTNPGFESGSTGWNSVGQTMSTGPACQNNCDAIPHSGSNVAYWTAPSAITNYAYQTVDLSGYASDIDAGNALIDATGWFISDEIPTQDRFWMQVKFYDGSSSEIVSDSYDTGTQEVATWTQYGISSYTIPVGARSVEIRFDTWEDSYGAGSADDFSVTVGTPCGGGGISFVRSDGVTGTSLTNFDIGTAGTDRLVVIIADVENTGAGADLTGVTVDTKACNHIVTADNPTDLGNHQEMWYCDEDDLGASNGPVTVAITSGITGWGVHAHLYTGVDQGGPADFGIDNTSAATNTVIVNGIDAPANGLVVMGAAEGTQGLAVNTWTSPLVERTNSPDPSSADLMTASDIETGAIGDGTDPGNVTIAPEAAITDLDAFTLVASAGTDTVNAATVTLGPAGAFNNIGQADITNASNVAQCTAITNPGSNTLSFTGCTIPVTTTVTTFKVRITPKTHASMPAVPGASYAVTGTITAFTSTNGQAGTDTDSATVTIDNLSPGNVTGAGATPGDTQVTVSWTNPGGDFSNVVVLRNTATISDVPTEGSSPAIDDTIGAGNSVVRYISSGTSFIDTGLSNGQIYFYRIFAKDTNGNYSATGVEVSATPAAGISFGGSAGSGDPTGNLISGFDIGTAGTDRLVVVFADHESTGTNLTDVTIDGKSCNLVAIADNAVGLGNHQEMWYCDEDDLGASFGPVDVALVGGATTWGTHVHLYTGVDQNGPSDSQIDNTSQAQFEILPAAIDIPANGLVVFGAANGESGTYNDADWDTSPTEGTDDGLSPEIEMTEVTDSPPNPNSAVLATSYWISSTGAQTNRLFRARGSIANNRGTGIIAAWGEASADSGGTFGYRKKITIDRSKISDASCGATLPNFPVLYSVTDTDLATTGNGGDVASYDAANNDPRDIIFRALDDDTCGGPVTSPCGLYHEIEKYDSTTGELIAWVRVPSVKTNDASNTSDTVIYIYYGNSDVVSSTQNADGVWDSNYKTVWHVNETSGGPGAIKDSTAPPNHGTDFNSPTFGATGKIGNAIDFDGTNDYATMPTSGFNTSAGTVELWTNIDTFPSADNKYIFSIGFMST